MKKTNLTCLWCGQKTNGTEDREHIFPKCIGGIEKLYAGAVCDKCNNMFSRPIDEALKREHFVMLDAFQVDPSIKGYKKDKKNTIRKKEERTDISGRYEAKDTRIVRNGLNIDFINVNYEVNSILFIQSLHKCVANILCNKYGSVYVRKHYSKLLEFVKNGGDWQRWSYAVSYACPSFLSVAKKRPLISKPIILNYCMVETYEKECEIFNFMHTSGIWMVGSHPCLVSQKIIEKISASILKHNDLLEWKESESQKPITDFFGFEWNKEKRDYIGELKFLWIVKSVEGKPNDDFLYILTRCKICGQINPTGFCASRNLIYTGNVDDCISYCTNTWNHYTKQDLEKLGLNLEEWDAESLEQYMKQPIAIPTENDVKKINIIMNCKNYNFQCFNCGNGINFDAKDCFI